MVQSAVELQEQLALARHINNYGWLADDFNWKEIAYIFTEDTVFDFKVPSDLEKQGPYSISTTQTSPFQTRRIANPSQSL